jgi:hypothetical protein
VSAAGPDAAGVLRVEIDVLSLVDVPAGLLARFGDRSTARAVAEAFAVRIERALAEHLAGERATGGRPDGGQPHRRLRRAADRRGADELDLLADGVAAAIAARLPRRTTASGGAGR